MEVLEMEGSQLRRSSIKRPWEEAQTLPENGNAWHSALLHPIDAVPYRRGSIQRGGDDAAKTNGTDSEESAMKKTKFEGHDYNTFPRQNQNAVVLNGKAAPSRNLNSIYTTQNRGSLDLESFKPNERPAPGLPNVNNNSGSADSHDPSNLCGRCRRLTIQSRQPSLGESDSCDDCKRNPELVWVTREAANWLSHLADTLSSGVSSEQRGIIRGLDHNHSGSSSCPPIAEFGLKQSLNWVLGRIYHVNHLADQLVKKAPEASLRTPSSGSKDVYRDGGAKAQDGPAADIMKRRIDVDSDDPFNSRDDADSSDSKPHTRRRSVTTSMSAMANEELPPLRSQADYPPPLPSLDGPLQRGGGSSWGRSLPSPTSLKLPSPSGPSYGINNAQGVNLPPPSSLHQQQQSSNSYLPPINATHTPDSALRDHTAALQHEVSVQKIALSSLQGEHDKLLAAFSRSQTRASALEKKHAVSDTEIISLTEEKLRLQAQVIELERDVEELARSRDGFRQAAVREGAQYVEIVQRATRLEEMAGEERKTWNKLKEDMERKIEALSAGNTGDLEAIRRNRELSPPTSRLQEMESDTPASTEGSRSELKMELTTSDPLLAAPARQESVEDLKAEIRRLQERCAEVKVALRVIRNDSRSVEDIVKTILGRVDSTLRS